MKNKGIDLSCARCGSNRLRIPATAEQPLVCEDCGADGQSLHAVQMLMTHGPEADQATARPEKRAARRERQTAEVEASQADLRNSVAETDRLVAVSDKMLRRHRQECDEAEGA